MSNNHVIKAAVLALCSSTLGANALAATAIDSCREITVPGAYIVTKNLTATNGNCLNVAASHVLLDLGGHRLQGNTGVAIGNKGDQVGITVRNGSISGFSVGVLLGRMTVVEQLLLEVQDTGITISSGRVQGNTIMGAGIRGIFAGANTIVTGNYLRQAVRGIQTIGSGASLVTDNTVLDSSLSGIGPTNVGDLLAGNTVRSTLTPIQANCPALFVGNVTNAVKKLTSPALCKFDDNIGQTP